MKITIYADLLYLLDFWMVYLTLVLQCLRRKQRAGGRVLTGALLAGAVSCMIQISGISGFFRLILTAGSMLLLQKYVFRSRIRSMILGACTNICFYFLLAGCLNFMILNTWLGVWILENMLFFWIGSLAAFLFLCGVVYFSRKKERYAAVKLCWHGIVICLTGLIDSGNQLLVPGTEEPVHVVSRSALQPWKKEKAEKILWIPYSSLGCQSGVLPALRIDWLCIEGGDIQREAVIAVSERNVSRNCQIILHPSENKRA